MVSDDGSTMAGTSDNASDNRRAFRWTAAGGMVNLGVLGTGNHIVIEKDGEVVREWRNGRTVALPIRTADGEVVEL